MSRDEHRLSIDGALLSPVSTLGKTGLRAYLAALLCLPISRPMAVRIGILSNFFNHSGGNSLAVVADNFRNPKHFATFLENRQSALWRSGREKQAGEIMYRREKTTV